MSNATRVEKQISPLTVREVKDSEYQKSNTTTAVLEQIVVIKSFYPATKVANSLQDNIFAQSEFGIEEQVFTSKETRIAFLLVPKGATKESVEKALENFPKANIYKILDSKPILTNEQKTAIDNKITTLEAIAEKQKVVNPETGEIILHNGKEQFRVTYFASQGKPDVDNRDKTPVETIATPKTTVTEITSAIQASTFEDATTLE